MKPAPAIAPRDHHEELLECVGQIPKEHDRLGEPARTIRWVVIVEREDEDGQRWLETHASGDSYRREIVGMLEDSKFQKLAELNRTIVHVEDGA